MKPLIVILGPTASGKTAFALKLAKKYQGEIICADSRTIYQGLIIGAASPLAEVATTKIKSQKAKDGTTIYLIQDIPHFLLHFVPPTKVFTVAQFQKLAYQIIDDILTRHKIPFLVGGSGLYVEAVTKGYFIPKVAPDFNLRKKLETQPTEKLYQKLQELDPSGASKISPSNKRRLIRALEVCLLTGQPFSKQRKIKKPPYDALMIGIRRPREELYRRIDRRVEKQVKMGLVQEVENLIKKGYSLDLPAMTGLGYKQIAGHLINKDPATLPIAIQQIKKETRHFARRQITWFKRDKEIKWVKSFQETEAIIEKFLSRKNHPSA